MTKNFRLIRDCFSQYFSWMTRFQHVHQQNPDDPRLSDSLPKFRRAMFTVGLLVRHFDFSKQQLYEGLPVSQFKDHNFLKFQWYFVSKIVLTFCEKKQERRDFAQCSQVYNLAINNLAIQQLGNFQFWQFNNLSILQFRQLAILAI